MEEFEGHWCLELVPMWSHPHPNPLPKGEGDLDPFVAGSVRGGWAFRRLRQSWIVARGPGCGQAPALHLSYSILGCRCYEDGGRCRRPVSESIPELAARPRRGTSPRATFSASATFGASILIVVARSGWRRHNKVCKVGVLVGGRVRGSLVPRARADVVSPSPQPSPKRRGRFRSFCCRFSSGRLGISPASAILDCRAWPWLWASPSATFSASATFGASILIVVARSGWRRHNKVCKVGVLVGGRVRGSLVPRARADVVSPSPQPSPKRRGRFGSFCCRFCSGRLGISPASAILDCRAWPWLGTGPRATCLSRGSRLCSLGRSWLVSPGGHDDPAWGDSRIAPTRDSCGCSGIRPSLIRERDMLPGQSLVPVAAGTPRYENWRELWVGRQRNWDGGSLPCGRTPTPAGDKPGPRYIVLIPPSAIGLQFGTFRRWSGRHRG